MGISELIAESNKKMVSMVNIKSIKKHYAALLSVARVNLYDMGWFTDPTCITEYDLRDLICKCPELFSLLTTNKGELATGWDLDNSNNVIKSMYTFAEYLVDDEDLKGFLQEYQKVLMYSGYCRSIDGVYAKLRIKKKGVTMRLARSGGMVYCRNGIEINKGFIQAFYPFTEVDSFTLKKLIYLKGVSILGLTANGKDGLFVDGLTMDQEVELAEIILNGIVKFEFLNGKYGNVLQSWLKNQRKVQGACAEHALGLYSHILQNESDYIMLCQEQAYNKLLDRGSIVVGMSTDTFFCINTENRKFEYPLSAFIIDSDSREILPECNVLEGFTGEVTLAREDIISTGCPITLYGKDGSLSEYYLIEDVIRDNITLNTAFYELDGRLTFDDTCSGSLNFRDSLSQEIYKSVLAAKQGVLLNTLDCNYTEFKKAKEKVVGKLLGGLNADNS